MGIHRNKTSEMIKRVETHHNKGVLKVGISDSPYDPGNLDIITFPAAMFIKLIKKEAKKGNIVVDSSITSVLCKEWRHCLHLGFKNVIKFSDALKPLMKKDAYRYGRGLIIILNKYDDKDMEELEMCPVDQGRFYREA